MNWWFSQILLFFSTPLKFSKINFHSSSSSLFEFWDGWDEWDGRLWDEWDGRLWDELWDDDGRWLWDERRRAEVRDEMVGGKTEPFNDLLWRTIEMRERAEMRCCCWLFSSFLLFWSQLCLKTDEMVEFEMRWWWWWKDKRSNRDEISLIVVASEEWERDVVVGGDWDVDGENGKMKGMTAGQIDWWYLGAKERK